MSTFAAWPFSFFVSAGAFMCPMAHANAPRDRMHVSMAHANAPRDRMHVSMAHVNVVA
jgi:hypothetical protein